MRVTEATKVGFGQRGCTAAMRVPTSNFMARRDRTRESKLEAWVQLTRRGGSNRLIANCRATLPFSTRICLTPTASRRVTTLLPVKRDRCTYKWVTLSYSRIHFGRMNFFPILWWFRAIDWKIVKGIIMKRKWNIVKYNETFDTRTVCNFKNEYQIGCISRRAFGVTLKKQPEERKNARV